MTQPTLTYALPGAEWQIHFPAEALATLSTHVQRSWWSKESFGQMFSRDLSCRTIVVDRVTCLQPRRSSFSGLVFDPGDLSAERQHLFSDGLHCLGLWHSHPEAVPVPSHKDRELIRDHSLCARPQLRGLVFAIVGTRSFPQGLGVYVDDGTELRVAHVRPT